jgi:hypothetical protein
MDLNQENKYITSSGELEINSWLYVIKKTILSTRKRILPQNDCQQFYEAKKRKKRNVLPWKGH